MEGQKRRGIRVWGSVLISLAIAAALYMIIYKCFSMVYAINDDVSMRNIAAGAMTGEPDGHLIFIKYALGLLISGMYRLFPGIDWYGLLISGLVMECLAVVLYRGLADIQNKRNRIFYVLFVLFLFLSTALKHVVLFQWTVTAGIVGATGVFLFYTSSEQDGRRNILEEIIAAFLLILVFCIRDMIFLMLLPVAGLCYLFKYVRISREKRTIFIRHVWFWPLVLGGCSLVMLLEAWAYRDREWKDYQEFNVYRSQVYDYYQVPSYAENQNFYISIGMGEEEVGALKNYSFFFVDDLYEYKMEKVANYAKDTDNSQEDRIISLVQGIQDVYSDFESSEYAPLCWFVMFGIVVSVALFQKQKSSQFYLVFACMGIQLLLWCYLGYQGRIVSRVSVAMHLYMLFLIGAFLYREFRNDGLNLPEILPGGAKCVLISCGVLLCLVSALEWGEARRDSDWAKEKNQENVVLCQYMEAHKENIYLLDTRSMLPYTDNFQIKGDFDVPNYLYLGGWQTFSPIEVKKRELLDIVDVAETLYRKENIYVISSADTTYIDNYYLNRYGSCYSETVDRIEFKDYGYKIETFMNVEESKNDENRF